MMSFLTDLVTGNVTNIRINNFNVRKKFTVPFLPVFGSY